jgi:hypothetical protein
LLGSLFAITACKATDTKNEVAAIIVNPTTESRAELLRIITTALSDAKVTLADDALTKSSVLTIEQKPLRNLDNKPLLGRNLGTPIQFHLLISNGQCVLEKQSNHKRWVLKKTDCTAK